MTIRQRFIQWYTASMYRGNALLAFLVLTLAMGYVIASIQTTANDYRENLARAVVTGCNRDFKTTTALKGILVASRESTRAQSTDTKRSEAFYKEQIEKLILPDCRIVAKLVRQTTGIVDPVPLFEKR